MKLRATFVSAITIAIAIASTTGAARAHFILRGPMCYSEQDPTGMPQKSAPCGQADPGMTVVETGAITTYGEGDEVTITIEEAIFHPGHYRVAIAPDMGGLPEDPPVTPGGTACGSTVIEAAPTLPILADGVLEHTRPFSGAQTITVRLPLGFTCSRCVLQVIEFMSSHGAPCFYHHCATLEVTPATTMTDGGVGTDSGMSGSDGGSPRDGGGVLPTDGSTVMRDGGTAARGAEGGCGCRVAPRSRAIARGPLGFAIALGVVGWRRRRAGRNR